MSRIAVSSFLGVAPKIASHLLDNSQAQIARNAKLWSQGLRPVGGLAAGEALSKTGTIQTIHRYNANGTWLCWTQAVNAVPGPTNNDTIEKLYFTGTDKPRVTTNALWDDGAPGTSIPPASWILGIPNPTVAPTIAAGAAGAITATVHYVYTFVRKYSDGWVEESGPSPISAALTVAAKKVDVSAMAITPMAAAADYGVTHVWIYRTEGGNYFFVAEVAIASIGATYSDNIATASLGDAIDTTTDLPWPDGLIGLVGLANGCIAGAKDNMVYISEPKKPHAYRELNLYAMNAAVVGLGVIGNTIVAITTAKPEIGRGVDPSAYSFKKQPGLFPCGSVRSIASSDLGVLWSTPRGMAICDGVTCDIATSNFISKDEWGHDFYPTTIHGVVHDGRYFGWFKTGTDVNGNYVGGGFVLDRTEKAFLTTLGEYAYAAHTVPGTDELYVVKKEPSAALANYVYRFEGDPSHPFVYDWKSKVYITPGLENLGFAQVIAEYGEGLNAAEIAALQAEIAAAVAFNAALTALDGAVDDLAINEGAMGGDTLLLAVPNASYVTGLVTFMYWADGVLKYTKNVTDSIPFPLPSGFEAQLHEFQVSGAVQVRQVKLAGTMEEIGGA